ncbi:hypothetical protein FAM8407_02936 [Lacticaseibacillus paracasei]|uniref:Uncharacterized protein n=1 Tax=Lacticaseibacillus paracasei TaxID=1597 RepID=A0A422M0S5_LACPA|nr:hypothetical protein FAM18110_02874 [Lacticaseibacillus paracasei]RND80264.1 hypothetical protein FAM18172_03082 [Lacticaseibacillus paracasei]RND86298.1 hypothetical protein FAM18175_02928 [Lacticaseibacillus paracasei]RNE41930.1 hypothetical protein FAM8407_02936 [Lacticaseibacillus paracasei]
MTNSSVGFPQFYQIQQILDRFLETLNGAKGYFQPSTNEIVIGGDEPDNALKLKTLYHE